ncbi:hypothetical protein [Pedobacter arcticus]|uniref:hypothetical protein n=1 Tax=Pedobacter arcticus TaxID=752140 RepID=UPI000302594D|nr:hypothetical protein [Pedobacter arcticus]
MDDFCPAVVSSCAAFKEKRRLRIDSLSQQKIKIQENFREKWLNWDDQLKEINSEQALLIKADAPFKWQVDSGLSGNAGNYQLYLIHDTKAIVAKKQGEQKNLKLSQTHEQSETVESVKEEKSISSITLQKTLFLLLILILFFGLCMGFKRFVK